LPTFNGATGEPLKRLLAPWSVKLLRRKLLSLLSEWVDVQFDKSLSQISTAAGCVTATFTDGSHAKGNLLIGADGTKSIVRQFLFGAEEAALIPSHVVMSAVIRTLSKETAVKLAALRPIHSMVSSEGIVRLYLAKQFIPISWAPSL
jgi:2-polyprenyl-6-methoxyphenol hydroxylase-like FAD-dependent oxidoreductase